MAYEDCDTVPFLWNYASRFTLFDNFFQHTIGPSSLNAIPMIAGQTGETQWLEHPEQANNVPALSALGRGEPVITDNDPFCGASADVTTVGRQPINARNPAAHYQLNCRIPKPMIPAMRRIPLTVIRDPNLTRAR